MAALTKIVCDSIERNTCGNGNFLLGDPKNLDGAGERIYFIKQLILDEAGSNTIPPPFSRMPLNLSDGRAYEMAEKIFSCQVFEYYYELQERVGSSKEVRVILPEIEVVSSDLKNARKIAEFIQAPDGSFVLVARYFFSILNPQNFYVESRNGGLFYQRLVKCKTTLDYVVSHNGKVFQAVEGVNYSAHGYERIEGICWGVFGCTYVFPHHKCLAAASIPAELLGSLFGTDRKDLVYY